jgi:hypothetical protein
MFAPVVAAGVRPILRLFRPAGEGGDPCTTWKGTVDQFASLGRHNEPPPHFSCSPAGTDMVDGRPAHKWSVTNTTASDNASGPSTVWIDDRLHLLTKSVDQNGSMEMRNVKEGNPSGDLFSPPADYQKIGVTEFLSALGKKPGQ